MDEKINKPLISDELTNKIIHLEQEIALNKVLLRREREIVERERKKLGEEIEEWKRKKNELEDEVCGLETKRDRLIKENTEKELTQERKQRDSIRKLEEDRVSNHMAFLEKAKELNDKETGYKNEIAALKSSLLELEEKNNILQAQLKEKKEISSQE